MRKCNVAGCQNDSTAKSLCHKHYRRYKRHNMHADVAQTPTEAPAIDMNEIGEWFEFKHGWKKTVAEACEVTRGTVQRWMQTGIPRFQYDKVYEYAAKNDLLETYDASLKSEGEVLLAAIRMNGSVAECEVKVLRWIK